jgi:cytochrome c biogenesis protein CcmG/thiol:disulfide interchange protein DsbE
VTATLPPPAPTPPNPPDPGGDGRGRSHTARWIAIGLAVVAVAFLVVLATRRSAEQAQADSPLLGRPAPEVIGTGLDGRTIRLSQLQGRYVLLNFFASWCGPCQREHDDLLRFQQAHEATGDATVLAVLFNDTPKAARAFFAKRGGDWPVITNQDAQVSLDFGVRGPPESFLISPEGIVLTRIVGEVDGARLDQLLAEAERLRAEDPGP